MFVAATLWAACGPAAALVASRFGSNVWLWFACGLIGGPFGLIFSLASGNDRSCEYCGRRIDRGAAVCPDCHRDISATASRPPVYQCAACGFRTASRPAFCTSCREPFHQAEHMMDRLVERKNERRMYSWLATWILILCSMGAYAWLYDPTLGHAGRLVYADETMMDSRTPNDTAFPGRRPFRIAKDDRVVRMPEVPTKSPSRAWIRIASGTHSGRTGVVDW